MTSNLVFLWDNFGPTHADRCEAVAAALAPSGRVVGLELSSKSGTYEWAPESSDRFEKITLSSGEFSEMSVFRQIRLLLRNALRIDNAVFFFCHYERPAVFITALVLRALGRLVFVMNDSKFDDYDRVMWRELLKSVLYTPYRGALVATPRSSKYLQFLGVPASAIRTGYDSISIERVRRKAGLGDALDQTPFEARPFVIVARLVAKKNLATALRAFAEYLRSGPVVLRRLVICGSGPQEEALRALAHDFGISEQVDFLGFQQSEAVCRLLASGLALLLPSVEEQFGFVIAEAQALGVPVIASFQCGATDTLVQSGVNGFIVEAENPRGFAYFMRLLSEDERLWRAMSTASEEFASRADVSKFVDAVAQLSGVGAVQASPRQQHGQ
jgi:glycosyltransferase involved in cell wall biosynthesis